LLKIILTASLFLWSAAFAAPENRSAKIHPAFGVDSKSEALLKTIKKPSAGDGTYTLTTDDVAALLKILQLTDLRIKAAVENIVNAKTIGYKKLVTIYAVSDPKARHPLQRSFQQGSLKHTGNKFDIAISSDVGFFAFKDPKGNLVYSRDGALRISGDGILRNSIGYELYPSITLPINALVEGFVVKETGEVFIHDGSQPKAVGQILLFTFPDLQDLVPLSACSCFQPPKAVKKPQELIPGLKMAGSLLQGYVELSNVNTIEEQVDYLDMIRFYNLIYDTLTRLDPSFVGDKKVHKYDPKFVKELLEANK